jgi:hypothetical protein
MNNKTFLLIHSGITGLFAFVLFFLPTLVWPMYGVELNDKYAVFLSQHNSIFLGGIAIIGFLFRNIEDNSKVLYQLIKGLMWTNILGFVITLYAALIGIFTGFGWSDPIFFASLSLFSFLQMKKNT